MFNSRNRLAPWQAGRAVRREWPDRTHEYIRFSQGDEDLARFVERDAAYWRRGSWRPTHSIVVISLREFTWHRRRRNCRSLDCPMAGDS